MIARRARCVPCPRALAGAASRAAHTHMRARARACSLLADKLQLPVGARPESHIVEVIRKAGLDAKIDCLHGQVVMAVPYPTMCARCEGRRRRR